MALNHVTLLPHQARQANTTTTATATNCAVLSFITFSCCCTNRRRWRRSHGHDSGGRIEAWGQRPSGAKPSQTCTAREKPTPASSRQPKTCRPQNHNKTNKHRIKTTPSLLTFELRRSCGGFLVVGLARCLSTRLACRMTRQTTPTFIALTRGIGHGVETLHACPIQTATSTTTNNLWAMNQKTLGA